MDHRRGCTLMTRVGCLGAALVTTSLTAPALAADRNRDPQPLDLVPVQQRSLFPKPSFSKHSAAAPQDTEQVTVVEDADALIAFEADQVTFDQDSGDTIATGNVYLKRDGYIVRAREVRINERKGTAVASGAVEITLPSKERITAPMIRLDDSVKQAFIENFRLIMTDGAQVAGTEGAHDQQTGVTTLNRAVYSPCEVCEGDTSPPIWQIKAVRVIHDRENRRLTYKNARLEFFGVPVLWTPYFAHPDPTVDRASGFLPFQIRTRNELGIVLEAPYHYVINDSQDVTVTPIFTTREGAVLAAEYRQHIGWGEFTLEGSATRTDVNDLDGNDTGESEFRGHFSGRGYLKHGAGWTSTFDLNIASDDTYLRRYNFSNVDVLVSSYSLQNFIGQSFLSARAFGFQGLRLEDDQGLTPFALPLLEAEYVAPFTPFGGTWTSGANALALTRFDGLDTQRASIYTNWRRRFTLPKGVLLTVDGLLRGDLYNVSDADLPDDPAFASGEGMTARGIARLNAEFAWPLIKPTGRGTHILEPRLHLTLAPNAGAPGDLVNEDSRAFELSDLNILSAERAPGFDLVEEGSRVTLGVDWKYQSQNWQTSLFVGQAIRLTGAEDQFDPGVGLTGDVSDVVGRAAVTYKSWLSLTQRFRLNDSDLAIRRNETTIRVGEQNKNFVQLGYLKLDRDLAFINREDREELRAFAAYQLDERWRLSASAIQDLTGGFDGVEYSIGLGYSDECFAFSVEVRRMFTEDRDIEPGTAVLFQLQLRNLG